MTRMKGISEALTGLLGKDSVLDDDECLRSYAEDESFVRPTKPRCVVKPKSADQVLKIVKWANDTLTPLVAVSSGPPRFRGDTVPSVGGTVIVDLSGMKKIIRVDRRNRAVMIEPGVTFGELIPELEKEGLAPMMPFVPRSSKSVLTCALEREPITTPRHHWDSLDPLCCTEVVYGTGDLFRTGSAAGPGTLKDQWKMGGAQVFAEGPSQTDFVRLIQGAEGTIGIVTWATVACRILPQVRSNFLVPSEKIEPLIDFTYKLLWKKLGEQCLMVNNQTLASILAQGQEELKALRSVLPPWILFFSLGGGGLAPQKKVAYQEAEFAEIASSFGMEPLRTLSGIEADRVADILTKPSSEPYWKVRHKGGWQEIFFISTLDKVPAFVAQSTELAAQHLYPPEDLGVYIQPTVQGCNCHCEFGLSYDPHNQEERTRVKSLVTDGSRAMASAGAFFSRPYGAWSDFAYGPGHETVIAYRKVKNIFDPNHILNPGKLCFQGA
jgi:hypothetical protein